MSNESTNPEPNWTPCTLEEAFELVWRMSEEGRVQPPMYTNWALKEEIKRWFIAGGCSERVNAARKSRTESQPQSV